VLALHISLLAEILAPHGGGKRRADPLFNHEDHSVMIPPEKSFIWQRNRKCGNISESMLLHSTAQ
jgi:hypothetical protein